MTQAEWMDGSKDGASRIIFCKAEARKLVRTPSTFPSIFPRRKLSEQVFGDRGEPGEVGRHM